MLDLHFSKEFGTALSKMGGKDFCSFNSLMKLFKSTLFPALIFGGRKLFEIFGENLDLKKFFNLDGDRRKEDIFQYQEFEIFCFSITECCLQEKE